MVDVHGGREMANEATKAMRHAVVTERKRCGQAIILWASQDVPSEPVPFLGVPALLSRLITMPLGYLPVRFVCDWHGTF